MKKIFALLFVLLAVFFVKNVYAKDGEAENGSGFSSSEETMDNGSDNEDSMDDESDDSGKDSEEDMTDDSNSSSGDEEMGEDSSMDDESGEDMNDDKGFDRPVKPIRNDASFFLKRFSEDKPTLLDKIKTEREGLNEGKGSLSPSEHRKVFDLSGEEGIKARGLVKMRFTNAVGNLERISVRIDSAITKATDSGKDTVKVKSLYDTAVSSIEDANTQVQEFVTLIENLDTTPEQAKTAGEEAKASIIKAHDDIKATVTELKSIMGVEASNQDSSSKESQN